MTYRYLTCTAALLALSACGARLTTALPASHAMVRPRRQQALLTNAIPAPSSGAYLGALVNPDGNQSTEVQQTHTLETQIGRTLALHTQFEDWNPNGVNPLSKVGSDPVILDDMQNGRVPVLSWRCGARLIDIASGTYDASIVIPAAKAVAALNYPVFLRWFWEFNLDIKGQGANKDSPACFDSTSSETPQTQFINAWEHIHSVFVANGATNVTWLWCPDGAPSFNSMPQLATYLPPDYDWIGFDSYDKTDVGFSRTVGKFYGAFSKYSKPLMITETAEESNATPYTQANFFNDAQTMMKSNFPLFRALMIFDAPGNGSNNWTLTTAGLSAYTALAGDAYFTPMPPTTLSRM